MEIWLGKASNASSNFPGLTSTSLGLGYSSLLSEDWEMPGVGYENNHPLLLSLTLWILSTSFSFFAIKLDPITVKLDKCGCLKHHLPIESGPVDKSAWDTKAHLITKHH